MLRARFSLLEKRHFTLLGICLAAMVALGLLINGARPVAGSQGGLTPLLSISGTLNANQTIAPTYDSNETAIFALRLMNGTGPVDLVISDSGGTIWSDQVLANETSWGTVDLSGQNTFSLTNQDGSGTIEFTFELFAVPAAPYTWSGVADPGGLESTIQLDFPQSGLYDFDFAVVGGERYLFTLNDTVIQKLINGPRSESYYVPAGTHQLKIVQASGGGIVDWDVAISYSGNSNNTTPFRQSGATVVGRETIPFNPAAPIQANLVFTATGATADLAIYDQNDVQIGPARTILPGETVWQSYDLPAGPNKIMVDAVGGTLDYEFVLDQLPGADGAVFAGSAADFGVNSMARVDFAQSGLYQFDYVVNSGTYQFILDNDYIQKSAVATGSVTFYVDQGVHELAIDQETTTGANWQLGLTRVAGNSDTLPYQKAGVEIGGTGNDFTEEWLPLFLDSATEVNLLFNSMGIDVETASLAVYEGLAATPSYTLTQVFGGESVWQTLSLAAGLNRIQVTAPANSSSLDFDLTLLAIPTAGAVNWSGSSLAAGENSVIRVDFPTTGLYRFTFEPTEGYGNLLPLLTVPDNPDRQPPTVISTSYDLQMNAGIHELIVVQDASYPETIWSATVAPVAAGPAFLNIDADLDAGESITQHFPGNMDFNVMVMAAGADLDIDILDGSSSLIWSETIIDGEMAWGTGTLVGDNEIIVTNKSGTPMSATVIFYHIPSAAGYDWSGLSNDAGLNSHIRVNFPSDGLYTFDFSQLSGRYQFQADVDNLTKVVETDSAVTAFMTAGVHDLHLLQDSNVGAEWSVAITAEAASSDVLPYQATGGNIGANDFSDEWLPIELGTATAANIEIQAFGAAADELALELHDTNGLVAELSPVYGGESIWTTVAIPARGWLHVAAAGGNGAPLSYTLSVEAIPTAGTSFSGGSLPGNSESSQLRVNFPSSGLYTFDLQVTAGQFQFQVGSDHILKTVTDTTSVAYYVPAGVHEINVFQNPSGSIMTAWDATISDVGAAADSLPYDKAGGEIGGVFSDEWLPLHLGSDALVNMQIAVVGGDSDNLMVTVLSGTTVVDSFNVLGSETIWRAINLPADASIHLDAAGSVLPVDYVFHVEVVSSPTHVWSGTSLSGGAQTSFFVDVEVAGLYQVVVASHQGFINFTHAPYTHMPEIQTGIVVTSEITLTAGIHQFTGSGSGNVNVWDTEISLLQAQAPDITAITPDTVFVNQGADVIISGDFFWVDTVELVSGSDRYPLTGVMWTENSIMATVPPSVPVGTYDVVVTNMDAQQAELTAGFVIELFRLHLPTIFNR